MQLTLEIFRSDKNLRTVGDMHIVLPPISLLMKELLNRLNITPSPQSTKSEIVVNQN